MLVREVTYWLSRPVERDGIRSGWGGNNHSITYLLYQFFPGRVHFHQQCERLLEIFTLAIRKGKFLDGTLCTQPFLTHALFGCYGHYIGVILMLCRLGLKYSLQNALFSGYVALNLSVKKDLGTKRVFNIRDNHLSVLLTKYISIISVINYTWPSLLWVIKSYFFRRTLLLFIVFFSRSEQKLEFSGRLQKTEVFNSISTGK